MRSFVVEFNSHPLDSLFQRCLSTPTDVARLLGQPKTRPILQVEALNVDEKQAPLQYSVTRFGGDFVQLVVSDDES